MRGLMSRPTSKSREIVGSGVRDVIELPVKSSFREGLTALEYFISTHGARKGLTDTALNTANSGYLTRRLIDVSQEVIALEEDCGTFDAHWVRPRADDEGVLVGDTRAFPTLAERILGRLAATPIGHPLTGEILVDRNEIISANLAKLVGDAGITECPVRSPLTCEARRGVCRMCYGTLPATGQLIELGQAAGIIAAQSIGEPGTQLTMRTFHTGGIAGVDITSGLPRVEELFEARAPKGAALLTDIDGLVEIARDSEGRRIRVVSREEFREDCAIPGDASLLVEEGDYVEPGQILAQRGLPDPDMNGDGAETDSSDVVEDLLAEEILATVSGRVELTPGGLSILWEDTEEREYIEGKDFQGASFIRVNDGDHVSAGDALTAVAVATDAPLNPHDILSIRGKDDLQDYLVNEVQKVYRSQGVTIHDKHMEIILRQMLRRVQVESTGDSDFIPGQMVDKAEFQDKNAMVLAEGGEPATAKPVLLGVTRASLLTDSFLAAASFQETTRVLTQASVSGAHDWLLGLKENVIIGRLIPARLELPEVKEPPKPELLPDILPELEDVVPAGWLETGEFDAPVPGFSFGSPEDEAETPLSGIFGPEPDYRESAAAAEALLGENGEQSGQTNGGGNPFGGYQASDADLESD